MKALWLGFSLVIALGMPLASAQSKKKVELSSQQRAEIEEALKKLGDAYSDVGDEARYKLGQHKFELLELAQDLYFGGFLSQAQYNAFETEIENKNDEEICTPITKSACGVSLKNFWKTFYTNKVKYKEPYCHLGGGVSTAGQCCGDLAKLPHTTFKGGSCKEESKECSSHNECCSKLCETNEDGGGTCAPVYSCYDLIEEGAECSDKNPYCEAPCDPTDESCDKRVVCQQVNYNSSGVGECKNLGKQCGSDTDCCSDKCEGGKCVFKSVCMDCAKMGEVPKEGQQCCPGTYQGLKGNCIQDFPPFTLPTSKVEQKPESGIFKKIAGILFPVAHAMQPQSVDEAGASAGGSGGASSPTSGSTSIEGGGERDCSGVDQSDGMDATQRQEYMKCLEDATKAGGYDDGEKLANARVACDMKKNEFQTHNKNIGCWANELSRKEYRDIFNMPEILSKTYSDVKSCKFNSLNDSWRSKSPMAKNAELVLRAFEYTYSGKGNDMIVSGNPVEPGKSQYYGQNIFGRAQRVATELRMNRYDLVKRFLEIDAKMTCKCLSIFGANKKADAGTTGPSGDGFYFDEDARNYYTQQCAGSDEYVTEDEINNDGGDVASSGEANEQTQVDRGATGLAQEKLLVEWLALRKEAQIMHFQNNEKLEEQMMDLSDFISNYDWLDTPTTEHKDHYLYDFHVTYMPGWLKVVAAIIIAVIVVVLTIVTFGGFAAVAAALAVSAAALAVGAAAAALALSMAIHGMFNNTKYDPTVFDKKVGNGCWKKVVGICVKKYDKYERYLQWPHFDNHNIASSLKDNNNHCAINGHASSCIKSVYLVSQEYSNSETSVIINNQPLLDVPLPITVSESAYKVEQVNNGKTYVDLLNASFNDDGLKGMKDTAGKYFKKKGSRYYVKKKHYNDAFKNKLLQEQENLEKFLLQNGEWAPEHFNQYKDAFVDGMVTYALCKKLVDCAQHSQSLIGSNDEEAIKHIGFGYLFETEEDAKLFGEYAYQMHLVWPRIAASQRIAYPTLGMDAYFQTIVYNLRLVGSLALQQSLHTTELYELYSADWERRKGAYAGLGGADQGPGSSNVEIGDRVFGEIKTLDFANGGNIEAFSAKLDNYEKSGDYSQAEMNVLRAVARHAIRSKEEKAKRDHYDKTVGATDRGKKKTKAAGAFNKAFNSPLDNIPMTVGGQTTGKGSASYNGNEKPLANIPKPKTESKSSMSDGNKALNFTMPSYSASAPTPSYGGFPEDGNSQLNTGMTNNEAEMMIEAASKDDSLEEVMPGDSLWNVVSKAYKRNLSRVLVLRSDIEEQKKAQATAAAKEDITDGAKAELKNLLESN